MSKVIVQVPAIGDPRFKRWAKVLSGVDTDKTDGWAFLGYFVDIDEFHELEVGDLILSYGGIGSHRYHTASVALSRVEADGSLFVIGGWDGLSSRGWAIKVRNPIAEQFMLNKERTRLYNEHGIQIYHRPESEIRDPVTNEPCCWWFAFQDNHYWNMTLAMALKQANQLIERECPAPKVELPHMTLTAEQLDSYVARNLTFRDALIRAAAAGEGLDEAIENERALTKHICDATSTLTLDDAQKGLLVSIVKLDESQLGNVVVPKLCKLLNVQRPIELQHPNYQQDGFPVNVWVDFYEGHIEVEIDGEMGEMHKFTSANDFAEWLLARQEELK